MKKFILTLLCLIAALPVWADRPMVGSHIRDWNVGDLSPVVIFDRDDIESSGARTVGEVLLDSTLAPYGGVSNFDTDFSARIRVRGANPERGVVLLNGRELPRTGSRYRNRASSMNVIPLSAVERIEVLTDGGSAVHGGGALFTVINIVTLEEVDGVEISVAPRIGSEKNSEEINTSLTYGEKFSKGGHFNTTLEVDHAFSERYDKDREDVDPKSLKRFDFSDNYGTSSIPIVAFPDCQEKTAHICTQYHGDINRTHEGSAISSYSEFGSEIGEGGFDLNVDLLLRYKDGMIVRPSGIRGLPLRPNEVPEEWKATPGLRYREGEALLLNHKLQGYEQARVYERYNVGNNIGISDDLGGGDWRWELNNNLGIYREKDTFKDSLDPHKMRQVLVENRYNPFLREGFEEVADEVFYDSEKHTSYLTDVVSLVTDGTLYRKENLKLAMAIGAEMGHEEYKEKGATRRRFFLRSDKRVVLSGTNGADADRQSQAAYTELSADYSDWLKAQLALRYDNYSDVGGGFSPKVALQALPLKGVRLRASVAQGHRPPELAESGGGESFEGTIKVSEKVECARNAISSANKKNCTADRWYQVRALPNSDIEEETSRSWSAGLGLGPFSGLNFGVDYWNYRVDNVIGFAPIGHFLELQAQGKNPDMADYGIMGIARDLNGNPDIDLISAAGLYNAGSELKEGIAVSTSYAFHDRSRLNFDYAKMLKDDYVLASITTSRLGDFGYPEYRYSVAWDYIFPGERYRFLVERETVGDHDNVPEHSQYNVTWWWNLEPELPGQLLFQGSNIFDSYPKKARLQDTFDNTGLYSSQALYMVRYRVRY